MGIRIPIIQGVTFAAVTPMIIIGQTHGVTAIYGSIIVAGAITYFIAPYFSRSDPFLSSCSNRQYYNDYRYYFNAGCCQVGGGR